LGDIKEIMVDMPSGKIAYAALSYGGVFTVGEKLFAVPCNALKLDTEDKRFILDIDKEGFKNSPGFDSSSWLNMADQSWSDSISTYYGAAVK
jgi:hypothetical protein